MESFGEDSEYEMGFEDEEKFERAEKPEEFLGIINIKILRPIFLLYKKNASTESCNGFRINE